MGDCYNARCHGVNRLFSFVVSLGIGLVLRAVLPKGIRVSDDDEARGLDLTQHAETGYSLEYVS